MGMSKWVDVSMGVIMGQVWQVTQEDLERFGTLEYTDIGKWVYLLSGCLSGFCDSREEAEDRLRATLGM